MKIRITLDSEEMTVEAPVTIGELLERLDLNPRVLSIALNGNVVRRSEYDSRYLADGDELQAVVQVGGG